MPPKSTKKGFKSVSSKKVVKESLTYEDVEDEHTITPKGPSSKSKAKSKSAEIERTFTSKEKDHVKGSSKKRQRTGEDDDVREDDENEPVPKKVKQTKSKSKPSRAETTKVVASKDSPSSSTKTPRPSKKIRRVQETVVAASVQEEEVEKEDIPIREETEAASGDADAANAPLAVKTYYPKIPFNHMKLAQDLTEKVKPGKKRKSLPAPVEDLVTAHQHKAAALVSAICTTEQQGLQDYFATSHSSRDNVLKSLTEVLDNLPAALQDYFVSDEGSSAVFEPELSSREQSLLESRFKYLQKMTADMEELQGYLDNVTKMGDDFGSSSVGVPVPPAVAPAASRLKDDKFNSKQGEQLFVGHLDSMSKYVNLVQRRLDEITTDMTYARASQDELYDACQKVRFSQHPPSTSAPETATPSRPAAPIFVSSRNFEGNKGSRTRSSNQHTTAKDAMKKLQRI